jgi:ribose/xylose/arabinose/galactoside ABC-type transport system permease subunit
MIDVKTAFEKQGIFIFLACLFSLASILSPAFLTAQNIKNILTPAAALGMVSIGQTFVILTGRGGLDLSVASVMASTAVMIASLTQGKDELLFPVICICLAFGIFVGLVNGVLVTKRGIQPFIATLGIMIIIQGLRFLYTRGAPKGTYPSLLRFLGTGNIGPIPTSIISLAMATIIACIVLEKTIYGRKVYAVGGNMNTAALSGYNTDAILISIYMISGFMAALAGIFLAGWLGVSDNWVGKGYEVDSIAAVVMGGTSFAGGRGGVLGTIAGVFILIIIYNLLLLLHLPHQAQLIVKGAIIILAVSFYARRSLH